MNVHEYVRWKCSTNERTPTILRRRDTRSSEALHEGGVHRRVTPVTPTIRVEENFTCRDLHRICTDPPQDFNRRPPSAGIRQPAGHGQRAQPAVQWMASLA
jgi:hypothetical protein